MARVKTQKLSTKALPEPETSSDQQLSRSSNEAADDQQLTSSSAASSSSSSGDEEEENKTPSTPPPPSKKSTTANKKITPQSPSSSDDSPPVAKLKSINNTVKPRSKSSGKRILESNEEEKDNFSSKRAKQEKSLSVEESPKKLFQRVFSGEDEIAMLKGLIEFKKRKGGDPMNYDDEFYSLMKKLLHAEVNKGQIVDKVRRLKKKFHNNAKKKNITNEHEKKLFALSKKVWEVEVDDDDGAEEEKNREDHVNVGVKTLNNGVIVDKKAKMNVNKKEDSEGGAKKGDDEGCTFKVGEIEVKEGMRLEALRRMGVEGRDAIREMWRKVEIAQLEVDLMRSEARVEESKRIMEALKH